MKSFQDLSRTWSKTPLQIQSRNHSTKKYLSIFSLILCSFIFLMDLSSTSTLVDISLKTVQAEPSIVAVPRPTFRPSEEMLEQASELYAQRCANCHGSKGDGKGVMASKLNPPPRNLRSYAWFKKTTPKYLKRVILGGGSAIGKSLLMPANPDLRNKPKLVEALIYYLEQLVDRPKK